MTPPRNNYNINNINNINMNNNYSINRINSPFYYSPSRNTGCRSCSMNSSNIFNDNNYHNFNGNNYQRPSTGNLLKRYNNINDNYNNDYNLRNNFNNNNNNNFKINQNINEINRNISLNQNRYYSPIRIPERDNRNDEISFNQNRYFSPLRSPPRNNLLRSFSNSNINNFSKSLNNNYNINDKFNNKNDDFDEIIQNNKKFRNYLNNNRNNYDYNYNFNTRNNNKNYHSPSINHNRNYNQNYNNINNYLNLRYNNYLLSKAQNENNNDRFIELNIFNYQKPIREMVIDRKTFFIFIYGSHDYTGKSWCSDCNIARPIVEESKNIIKDKRYEKEVYFISIPIDKINMVDLKYDSIIQLERVPTLIYIENGREKNRLIENDLFSYQNVNSFIRQPYDQFNQLRRNNYLYQPRNYY